MLTHLFDLKAVLLAKHAQHIVLIHFPIALFFASGLFDLVAQWKQSASLRTAASINLLGASISSIPAAATGIIAWQVLYGGGMPKGILLYHMIGAAASLALMWTLVIIRRRDRKEIKAHLPRAYVILSVITCVVTMATAHLGGVLSGVVTLAE